MSDDEQDATEREILLREMREISHVLFKKPWADEIEYKLWAVMVGDAEDIDGKRLAVPILAHIDALNQYTDKAGGWFAGETLEQFVSHDEWEPRYAAWRAKKK